MSQKIRIFAFSDIHSPDSFQMSELDSKDFDLVLTLGDIPRDTLGYILFMSKRIESYGILGNHDPKEIIALNNIHCRVVEFKGIKIGGFSGSLKYRDEPNQYTEKEVAKKIQRMPYVDIFISHSPPYSVSDQNDPVHCGFKAFDDYIEQKRPKYWLHGHLGVKTRTKICDTEIYGIVEKQPLFLEI